MKIKIVTSGWHYADSREHFDRRAYANQVLARRAAGLDNWQRCADTA